MIVVVLISILLSFLLMSKIYSESTTSNHVRHQHLHFHRPQNIYNNSIKLPIVYVYTVVPAICKYGLPDYIKISLEQGILTQSDCDVILVSNFNQCSFIRKSVKDMPNLTLVDSTTIISQRTQEFANLSTNIFQTDGAGELWLTSALRFLIMEDLMLAHGYHELIHVEADNMLYGKLTTLLPTLRNSYRGLAATPLNTDKSFITASVLWISKVSSLLKFNNYLLALGANKHQYWTKYLRWLRKYACCKRGGIDPDENGNGIKPFAINEMSMLAFYHHEHPNEFKLFPVVPAYNFITNRHVINMSYYGPHGQEVGAPTGHGIWDPNSWGQLIGGTSSKRGRDIGFTDPSHIAGQAIRLNSCVVRMMCGNQTTYSYAFPPHFIDPLHEYELHASSSSNNNKNDNDLEKLNQLSRFDNVEDRDHNEQKSIEHHMKVLEYNWFHKYKEKNCYTAPFVQCGGPYGTPLSEWTPLWNLHVHSKHTQDYLSAPCDCHTTNTVVIDSTPISNNNTSTTTDTIAV